MKKIYAFFLLFLASTLSVFSQENNKQYEKLLTDAPFIFKGTVKSYKAFRKGNDKKLYASYIINIETIYKGINKLKLGTVELIYDAPDTWELSDEWGLIKNREFSLYATDDDRENAVGLFELTNGTSGIFVCNKLNDDGFSSSNVKTDNTIVLTPSCSASNCFFSYVSSAKHKDGEFFPRKYIKGFGKYFEQMGKIDKKTGVTIWDEEITVYEKLDKYLKEIGITLQKEIVKKKDATNFDTLKTN